MRGGLRSRRPAAQPNCGGATIQLEMKKSIRHLCLVTLAGLALASCAARETEIHTTTGARAEGSGVTDARDVSGGPGAGAAAAAAGPIGHPGN